MIDNQLQVELSHQDTPLDTARHGVSLPFEWERMDEKWMSGNANDGSRRRVC